MNIPADLLEILACPSCHAPLRADEAADLLECARCGLRYPVRDDIPVLLIDEALPPVASGAAEGAAQEAAGEAAEKATEDAAEQAAGGAADPGGRATNEPAEVAADQPPPERGAAP